MAAEITALPTPPSRSDPVNFSVRADAFLGALPLFQTEANTLAAEAEADALLAETKRNEASTFASNASASASAAAASLDSFDDRYLGPKASAPTLDNDGQTLLVGALYFDTTLNRMRVRNNANNAWLDAYYTDENLTVTNLTVSGALSLPDGAVTLGTETQGNYVAAVGAGTSGAQTGSSGLTITGTGEGASVTIAHADTSSQASVNNSGNTVIQDLTFDTYGHVTGAVSATIDTVTNAVNANVTGTNASDNFPLVFADSVGSGFKTLLMNGSAPSAGTYNPTTGTANISVQGNSGTATALQTARNINGVPFNGTANVQVTTAGSGIAVAGAEISHADTSSQASVDNSGYTVIQDITLDTFGHITAIASTTLQKPLGVDQTLQSPSRFINTTYTNTTGQVIYVSVTGVAGFESTATLALFINGVAFASVFMANDSSPSTVQGIVLPGDTYTVTTTGSITSWREIRTT